MKRNKNKDHLQNGHGRLGSRRLHTFQQMGLVHDDHVEMRLGQLGGVPGQQIVTGDVHKQIAAIPGRHANADLIGPHAGHPTAILLQEKIGSTESWGQTL